MVVVAIFFAALVLPARSEDAPAAGQSDLATAYSQAMAEFQAGNFAKAATELEALVARVEVTPQVEPIFYTIGSAYFNAGDYPKAITAFKNYQAKFPKGAHTGGVAFGIAQSNLLSKNFKEAAAQMAALENDPQLAEQALIFEAEAFKSSGKNDDAIRALEKLTGKGIHTADEMRGAISLAQLYAQKGDGSKALRTLESIHQNISLVDNILELNALTIESRRQVLRKTAIQGSARLLSLRLSARADHQAAEQPDRFDAAPDRAKPRRRPG